MSAAQVKGNNFIFGAYTHCSWPSAEGIIADPTGMSFLFSLVNGSGKAVRFSLREKGRAVQLTSTRVRFGASSGSGHGQSGWPNVILMHDGRAADEKKGNCANDVDGGAAYQPDAAAFACDITFLAGQEFFAAAEIEVFQL